ncbi:hypothetical protein HID58_079886, partial [Brassica napus]
LATSKSMQLLMMEALWERSGNIRWWDVTTVQSSAFNSHKDEVRRTKSSHVVAGDRSRGRVAVLFNDNTFFVDDLVSPKRIHYFL